MQHQDPLQGRTGLCGQWIPNRCQLFRTDLRCRAALLPFTSSTGPPVPGDQGGSMKTPSCQPGLGYTIKQYWLQTSCQVDWGFVWLALHFNFFLYLGLLPPPSFHMCWSLKDILYTRLFLGTWFQRTQNIQIMNKLYNYSLDNWNLDFHLYQYNFWLLSS